MKALIRKIFAALSNDAGHKARAEQYRDEFESEALASGDFKGVRFTRLDDGKYADPRLESEWVSWLRKAMLIDDVV